MGVGRNEPCPCGSGKKYKKCCLNREQNILAENNLQSQNLQEEKEDKDLENQAFWINAMNNLRMFSLGKKPHIKEYQKIRKLHGEIVGTMMDYFHDGKFEHKIDPDYVYEYTEEDATKRDEFIYNEYDFNFETDIGVHGFQNITIYKIAPNMNCIIEDFINKHRYRKPEKIEFLQSMLHSKSGLFEVTGTDFSEGYAYIKDVFTGNEYKLTDIGLSGNKNHDDIYIYTRIITYRDISFGTGLNLVFNKTDPFIQNFIKRQKQSYKPVGELLRFTELYNRFSKDSKRIRTVSNI